jgi:hypothetical protein
MKKKGFMMLPCIAAVAIATFIGTKAIKPNVNDLLLQNVEALSNNSDITTGGTSTIMWQNSHICLMRYDPNLRTDVPTDSVKGESIGKLCMSEKDIKNAKAKGYHYNSHVHNYMICKEKLENID